MGASVPDTGSHPTGQAELHRLDASRFDPARFEDVAKGCDVIAERICDFAISGSFCEDIGELERLHDALANEVANLSVLLRETANALAERGQ